VTKNRGGEGDGDLNLSERYGDVSLLGLMGVAIRTVAPLPRCSGEMAMLVRFFQTPDKFIGHRRMPETMR